MQPNRLTTCAPGQVLLGTGVCAVSIPRQALANVEEEEQYLLSLSPFNPLGSSPNASRFQYEQSDLHSQKSYCGQQAHLIYATEYAQEHHIPNPYKYSTVGTPAQCFLIGRTIGSAYSGQPFGGFNNSAGLPNNNSNLPGFAVSNNTNVRSNPNVSNRNLSNYPLTRSRYRQSQQQPQ